MVTNQLITAMPVSLELVKGWCRVEHDADNEILEMLLLSAYQTFDTFLNRSFAADAPELLDIKRALLQSVNYWYENRGEAGKIPALAQQTLLSYRLEPGF